MAVILNLDTTILNQYSTVILEGSEYAIHLYWNDRSGWYLSFYDTDLFDKNKRDNSSALLLGGKKLMPRQNLLNKLPPSLTDKLPKGGLFCIDTTPTQIPSPYTVTRDNFGKGKKFQLFYYTETEVGLLS